MKKLLIFLLAISSCATLPCRSTQISPRTRRQRTHSSHTSKKTIKRNSSTKAKKIIVAGIAAAAGFVVLYIAYQLNKKRKHKAALLSAKQKKGKGKEPLADARRIAKGNEKKDPPIKLKEENKAAAALLASQTKDNKEKESIRKQEEEERKKQYRISRRYNREWFRAEKSAYAEELTPQEIQDGENLIKILISNDPRPHYLASHQSSGVVFSDRRDKGKKGGTGLILKSSNKGHKTAIRRVNIETAAYKWTQTLESSLVVVPQVKLSKTSNRFLYTRMIKGVITDEFDHLVFCASHIEQTKFPALATMIYLSDFHVDDLFDTQTQNHDYRYYWGFDKTVDNTGYLQIKTCNFAIFLEQTSNGEEVYRMGLLDPEDWWRKKDNSGIDLEAFKILAYFFPHNSEYICKMFREFAKAKGGSKGKYLLDSDRKYLLDSDIESNIKYHKKAAELKMKYINFVYYKHFDLLIAKDKNLMFTQNLAFDEQDIRNAIKEDSKILGDLGIKYTNFYNGYYKRKIKTITVPAEAFMQLASLIVGILKKRLNRNLKPELGKREEIINSLREKLNKRGEIINNLREKLDESEEDINKLREKIINNFNIKECELISCIIKHRKYALDAKKIQTLMKKTSRQSDEKKTNFFQMLQGKTDNIGGVSDEDFNTNIEDDKIKKAFLIQFIRSFFLLLSQKKWIVSYVETEYCFYCGF